MCDSNNMNHYWTNQTADFCHQGNPLPYNINSIQNTSTKAYLNPQIVNCDLIKRKLSSTLQGGNKIHVNPNFKGSNLSGNYPHLIKTVDSQDILSIPGTSKTSSVSENKTNSFLNEEQRNTKCATPIPVQSRFKKINAVNSRNYKSSYSWRKSTSNYNSVSSNKITAPLNSPKLASEKAKNFSNLTYKLPKKLNPVLNESCQSGKNSLIYRSKTKIINKPKTKLLNNTPSKTKHFLKEVNNLPIKRQLISSKFASSKNKMSTISKVAKGVRNKYIYLNNVEQFKKSKYKIDKRNKFPETVKKSNPYKIKDISKLFPNYFYGKIKLPSCNVYNLESCRTKTSWRKNQHFHKAPQKIINNEFPNKCVVKIGGILYKSTGNKLTLARNKHDTTQKKIINNGSKAKKNHIVYVRGEKFILEKNGKALKRQFSNETNDKSPLLTPKRIDLGGVTYIKKSENILIRTNVHQARHLVCKAKNKSIATLANLRKRCSMPCMIYHRFGKCNRHIKGLCMYKHDPQNISVCKKFLKGNCDEKNCLLSHQIVQEKMATCHFYLNGLCVRENCPFLHVKLNKNASICKNFLEGFCKLGKECSKRHVHQCPNFDENGTCDLGPKCPYPHKNLKKAENLNENSSKLKDENEKLQYYIHSDNQGKAKKNKKCTNKTKGMNKVPKKKGKKKDLSLGNLDESTATIKCFPKRIKLDKLPCFIPLNSES